MSDSIVDVNKKITDSKKTDFVNASSSVIGNINFKLIFYMFLLGIILFSDLFISNVLTHIPDSVDGEYVTNKGTMIQLLVYSLGLLVFDLVIKYDII